MMDIIIDNFVITVN